MTRYLTLIFLVGGTISSGCSHSETTQCRSKDDCAPGEDCVDGRCRPVDPCRDMVCEQGQHCENGVCVADTCQEDQCTNSPEDFCLDDHTLRRFSQSGTCRNNECHYDSEDLDCPDGCRDGQCQGCQPEGHCPTDRECGDYTDSCGSTYHCGDCAAWQTCEQGRCQAKSGVICVAPEGSGQDCTEQAPCSLETAQTIVRGLAPDMSDDIHLVLRGGIYELDAPLKLGPEDSGRNGHAVIYEAYPGEEPVLSGGRTITGWTVHDAALGIYQATVPANLATRQLYVDGKRATRARSGFNPSFTETAAGYQAPDATMASWGNPTKIEFVDLSYWRTYRCPVASISGTDITMAQPCWNRAHLHMNYAMGAPDWIENAYELLDEPGEWYLDESQGLLFLIFPEGSTPDNAQVTVPVLETLVSLSGTAGDPVHDIRFSGITFAYATWLRPSTNEGYPCKQGGVLYLDSPSATYETPGNVTVDHGRTITFSHCTFEHLGAQGLVVERGSSQVTVEGSVFRDISSGAVRIGNVDDPNPTDPNDVTRNNEVRNTFVTECGREFFDGVGLFAGYTDGTLFEHNEIRNVSYSGMSVGWGWSTTPTVAANNRVAYNLGAHVMQRLHDGGQIYTLSTQPNSSIQGNFFHSQVHVYGSIYLDQGTQHYSITDNVVASAPYWYIMQPTVAPRASENTMRHNWSDGDTGFCCGNLGCCTEVNTVENNHIFPPGDFPVGARRIVDQAGLEDEYLALRPTTLRVEAEDYDQGGEGVGYHDLQSGNAGGAYQGDDVDIYACSRCSNDHTVGYTQTDEWLAYTIDVRPGGHYDFTFRVGVRDPGCRIALTLDGRDMGTVDLPVTGSWSDYEDVTLPDLVMATGPHRIVLTFTGGFNFDFFTYHLTSPRCDPTGQVQPTARLNGDFDGDGTADSLSIYQQSLCWEVSTAAGASVWLTGWGTAATKVGGDFDGDGRSDLVVIFQTADQRWHWLLALSAGRSFVKIPDAQVGYGPGNGACAKDYDGDGADELIVEWSPNICGDLDTSTWTFTTNANCSQTCN